MQYLNTLKGTFIRVSQCFYIYFSRSSSQMKALKAIICKCFSSFHAYLNLLKCNLPGYWHVAHPWKTFFHLVLPEYIIWIKIPFCVHLNGFIYSSNIATICLVLAFRSVFLFSGIFTRINQSFWLREENSRKQDFSPPSHRSHPMVGTGITCQTCFKLVANTV